MTETTNTTPQNRNRTMAKNMSNNEMYDMITDRIIKALEGDIIPWSKPWATEGGLRCFPRSVSTGKMYNGINTWLLGLMGYNSPWWITEGQLTKRGGTLKADAQPTQVVFWKFFKTEDKTTKKERTIPMLRCFEAYNIEQCNLPEAELLKLAKRLDKLAGKKVVKTDADKNATIEVCEATIRAYLDGQSLTVSDAPSAFYRPVQDTLHMPTLDTFTTSEHYYATLFHEAVHSTGHESRLNRKGITDKNGMGSPEYAREELTAELGASFLCGVTGIDTKPVTDNRDAYIKGWLKALKNDNKCIMVASGKAGKASDYILGTSPEGDIEYTPKKK